MSSARGMLNCGDWAQGQGERSIGLYVVSIPLAFVSPWISRSISRGAELVRARSADRVDREDVIFR